MTDKQRPNAHKEFRGLGKRRDRKERHSKRVTRESNEFERNITRKFKIWHWDKIEDETVDYLIVEVNFTKKMTPKRFLALLHEKLGDEI